MYIMCVCLFSALSRRVGALQISISIIIIKVHLSLRLVFVASFKKRDTAQKINHRRQKEKDPELSDVESRKCLKCQRWKVGECVRYRRSNVWSVWDVEGRTRGVCGMSKVERGDCVGCRK